MMESLVVAKRSIIWEAAKGRRIALVCAASVAVMAIGVFHAPVWPVLLGCGGAAVILICRDCLMGTWKK
jgi:hypothetical protein